MWILVVHRGPSIPLASFLALENEGGIVGRREGESTRGWLCILAPSPPAPSVRESRPSISLRLSLRVHRLSLSLALPLSPFQPLLFLSLSLSRITAPFLQLTFVKMTFIIIATAGCSALAPPPPLPRSILIFIIFIRANLTRAYYSPFIDFAGCNCVFRRESRSSLMSSRDRRYYSNYSFGARMCIYFLRPVTSLPVIS